MKAGSWVVAWLLAAGIGATVSIALGAEKAICLVCKVKEGKREGEVVEAARTHDGVRYDFCSEKCAKEFDADVAAFLPPLFPRRAPELSLSDLTGRAVNWETLSGKAVLVDFWATWCVPCRKSMPGLQALHDKYSGRGFTVVGVSIDEAKTAGNVKKFAAARRITYPIAIDTARTPAWARFRVRAVPAAFLVDPRGRIVAQWMGAAVDVRELEQKLLPLLLRPD